MLVSGPVRAAVRAVTTGTRPGSGEFRQEPSENMISCERIDIVEHSGGLGG